MLCEDEIGFDDIEFGSTTDRSDNNKNEANEQPHTGRNMI